MEIEGIVTKGSSVQPKLVTSVQYCAATSLYRTLEHRDETSPDLGIEDNGRPRLPTNGMLSKEDAEGNPLELEQGLSTYKDYQTIVLQEMPERAKVGQLPRSIELMLEYDLVDKVKPGDRVRCVGVYQPLAPPVLKGQCSGFFKPVLICNNISVIGKEVGAVKLTAPDIKNIKYVTPFCIDICYLYLLLLSERLLCHQLQRGNLSTSKSSYILLIQIKNLKSLIMKIVLFWNSRF